MVTKVSRNRLPPGAVTEMPGIYDVSDSVGITAGAARPPNQRDDVLLVQYFLQSIYKVAKLRPLGHLAVDGVYGPMTHYWSLFFMHHIELLSDGQTDIYEEGGNIVPFMRNSQRFSGAAGRSMIFQLNYQFWKTHKGTFDHLERDEPTTPHELKQALLKALESNRKASAAP